MTEQASHKIRPLCYAEWKSSGTLTIDSQRTDNPVNYNGSVFRDHRILRPFEGRTKSVTIAHKADKAFNIPNLWFHRTCLAQAKRFLKVRVLLAICIAHRLLDRHLLSFCPGRIKCGSVEQFVRSL